MYSYLIYVKFLNIFNRLCDCAYTLYCLLLVIADGYQSYGNCSYLNKMQHELSANRFISVHIGYVFNIWLANHVFVRTGRHHHDPQVTTYNIKVFVF